MLFHRIRTLVSIVSLYLFLYACTNPQESATQLPSKEKPAIPLEKLVDSLGLQHETFHLLIDKSDFTLKVQVNEKTIKTYAVVLGTNPVDDKKMEGDRATPEGVFKIRDKYPHAKWTKFIWIDYPNASSREKFNARKAAGEIPADARIGGEIGIHGVPEGRNDLIDQKVNWTWGCISLKNSEVNEIYPFLSDASLVTIQQ